MIKLIIPIVFINKCPPVSLARLTACLLTTSDRHYARRTQGKDISYREASGVSSVARETMDIYSTVDSVSSTIGFVFRIQSLHLSAVDVDRHDTGAARDDVAHLSSKTSQLLPRSCLRIAKDGS